MRRGDVYYVTSVRDVHEYGSEQRSGRPAIIVSNDKNNEFSPVVEVVYLTTKPKNRLPTHIDIRATGRTSIAICEQITSVSVERLGDYVGSLSDLELEMLDAALEISLDLKGSTALNKTALFATGTPPAQTTSPADGDTEEQTVLRAQRDLYKTLYEQLLERIMKR
ncbi:MAG: type II toxin-antitoxin system PemK/MazF family toxin [Clostridia bacterium]|nr:type II toxin-antitoxin system PemK/MazF family toxin [Clostridia bacterium]